MGWKRSEPLQRVLRLKLWVISVDRGTRRLSSTPLCQQVFSASIQIPHIQTVLTNHIEDAALGHKMWQFINCFLKLNLLVLFLSESWKQWWWERGHAICARCRLVNHYQIWRGLWPYECWWVKFISYSYRWLPAHLPRAGADQLLTSDINPSVVTRTFKWIRDNVTNHSRGGMRDTENRLGVLSVCVPFFHCFTSLDSTKRISAALLTITLM